MGEGECLIGYVWEGEGKCGRFARCTRSMTGAMVREQCERCVRDEGEDVMTEVRRVRDEWPRILLH